METRKAPPRDGRSLLQRFLADVGEAEPSQLQPSDFQERALWAVLEGQDALVVAPTGSGKTWIAEKAMERFLREGRVCWYTSPLKALSNQKYERFKGLYGAESVGLLTGERRENARAPIIVATTEVLRNALYEGDVRPYLIVLDEAHYLGDPERGTTWEEVIVLAPPESRLLLLSATVSNAGELSDWLREVRPRRVQLVRTRERPVPLRYGLLTRTYRLLPLERELAPSYPERELSASFDPVRVVQVLGKFNLLPAIVFLPRRRDCDEAAAQFRGLIWEGEHERSQRFTQVAGDSRFLWRHPLLGPLLQAGVAAHHAGHLTGWKVAVEQLLEQGLVRAVFATTTLAAGLDVPARTVVLSTLRGRDERGVRDITALEFHQMSGRAGRRGRDRVGFVIVVPRGARDLQTALTLRDLEAEPVASALALAYYRVLNLLPRFGLEGSRDFLESSFYLYQRGGRTVRRRLFRELDQRIALLQAMGYLTQDHALTELGRWATLVRHEHSLVVAEMVRRGLYQDLDPSALAGWLAAIIGSRAPYRMAARVPLRALQRLVQEVEAMEKEHGVPPLGLAQEFLPDTREAFRIGRPGDAWRRAAAVKLWAQGEAWDALVARCDSDEGDLQRLVLQTAEVLRELEDLPFLDLADKAAAAREALMREPVF